MLPVPHGKSRHAVAARPAACHVVPGQQCYGADEWRLARDDGFGCPADEDEDEDVAALFAVRPERSRLSVSCAERGSHPSAAGRVRRHTIEKRVRCAGRGGRGRLASGDGDKKEQGAFPRLPDCNLELI